jgi:hypothetical protein
VLHCVQGGCVGLVAMEGQCHDAFQRGDERCHLIPSMTTCRAAACSQIPAVAVLIALMLLSTGTHIIGHLAQIPSFCTCTCSPATYD